MRFRNSSGRRIRLESGARMNAEECCCGGDIWCTEGLTEEVGEIVAIVAGIGTGISCGGIDHCGTIYNRTYDNTIAGPAPLTSGSCSSISGASVIGNCSTEWRWEVSDYGLCTFATRGATFSISKRSDGTWLAGFGLRTSTRVIAWYKDYGTTLPTLPITFTSTDLRSCTGILCDVSGATVSVSLV